ncbi:MAG: hypothetical protein AAGF79_10445, partial [Pseudomonadota bacterium]
LSPNSDVTRMFLASICGLTDRVEEARTLWAELEEISPGFTLSRYLDMIGSRSGAWEPLLIQGLKNAGLDS